MSKVDITTLKPSELLEHALMDLEAVEAMPDKYVIDMNDWHDFNGYKCHVCLAGAVLANTLGYDYTDSEEEVLDGLDPKIDRLTSAINEFRCGYIYSGLVYMGYGDNIPEELKEYPVKKAYKICSQYIPGKGDKFKESIRMIIRDLKKYGY